MIELRDIAFSYGDGALTGNETDERPVLHGIDLSLDEGELVLVAGRTGVGKSTLLGVFNGLVPTFTGGTLSGQVLLDGDDVTLLPPRDRAHLVGYVGQDPLSGFVTDTVEEELAFGPEQLGLDAATMRRRVEETLDLLGIAELRNRDLRTLSGGQQQRVAIGAVLTMHPRVLVLDEPTSALDPTAAEDVLATLTRLVHDVGLTVVLAEHRLERVIPFADQMVLLDGCGGIRVGTPAEILRDSPVAPPIVELGRWAGWEPLPLSVRDARRRARTLDLPAAPTPPRRESGRVLLDLHRIQVAYGRVTAVQDVSLALHSGEVTALMGRNGSGKSSLLWAAHGQGRGRVGLVPQTPSDLLYLETVADELATADADAGHGLPGDAAAVLERLAPGIDLTTHPRDLSEGQRLALVLALVLRAGPEVLLLDEPTRGLDYPGKAALVRIIQDLVSQGHAVLVATHDVEFVAQVADRVAVLAEGELVADGPTAEVVAQTPAFAPQVQKVLGDGWLTIAQVESAGRA